MTSEIEEAFDQLRMPFYGGFRFQPTDVELVRDHLLNKVEGKPMPFDWIVKECDLYGVQEPWQIWQAYGGSQLYEGQDLYLFTRLKSGKSGNLKMRPIRMVATGTWKAAYASDVVDRDTNTKIGLFTCLKYKKHNDTNMAKQVSWLLHQYRLVGFMTDSVLCQLRKIVLANNTQRQDRSSRTLYDSPCSDDAIIVEA